MFYFNHAQIQKYQQDLVEPLKVMLKLLKFSGLNSNDLKASDKIMF